MKIPLRYLLPVIAAITLAACATLNPQPATQVISAAPDTIIDLLSQKIIDRDQLIDKIIASDYVVLGEKHDNPQHHVLQLWVLQQLTTKQWLQQLSLEMITPAQQKEFSVLTPALAENATDLQQALAWPAQGWPWQDYRALAQLAVKNAIALQSANIDREQIMALYQGKLTPPEINLSAEARTALLQDIEHSHCGHIKAPQTTNMLSIQLARDHAMAQSLLKTPHGAALIAGAFHARKDLGFPQHLQRLAPGKKLLALALVEADSALTQPELSELAQQYDVVWVTAEHQREDPCAVFEKQK